MTLHLHLTVTDKSAARLVMDLLQKLSESASPQTIPEGSLQKGAAAPPSLASIPTSADFLYKLIRLDKPAVSLRAGESAEVTIASGAPGPVVLSVPAALPGLEATLDKSTLPGGGKATLTLRAAKGAKSGVLNVQVEPTMQVLPVRITIVE